MNQVFITLLALLTFAGTGCESYSGKRPTLTKSALSNDANGKEGAETEDGNDTTNPGEEDKELGQDEEQNPETPKGDEETPEEMPMNKCMLPSPATETF